MLNYGINNRKYQEYNGDLGPYQSTWIDQQFPWNSLQKKKQLIGPNPQLNIATPDYDKLQLSLNTEAQIPNKQLAEGTQSIINEIQTEQQKKLNSNQNIFQKTGQFFMNNADTISQVSNITGNLANGINTIIGGKDPAAGPKGNLRAGVDAGWNSVADGVSKLGPYGEMAGAAMKAIGALNSIQNVALGNKALDNMTTTDALLSSPLGQLIPGLGLVNALAGKNTDTITKNDEAFAQVGSSFGGANNTVDEALKRSGKRYGAFSSGARKDANAEIAMARNQQSTIEELATESQTRNDLMGSMSSILGNRRAFDMLGGYDQSAIRVGKEGMSINPKETSTFEIQLETTIGEISIFKEGGELEEKEISPIEYAIQRFPILSTLEPINLQYDQNFNPREIGDFGDIEYMQSQYDTLPYYNDYPKNEEFKGKSTIVYNDNVSNEDIALDWLSHGLREHDPKWNKFLEQLGKDSIWKEKILDELFGEFLQNKKISPEKYSKISRKQRNILNDEFDKQEIDQEQYDSVLDGLIRGILVNDEYREKLRYAPKDEYQNLENSFIWQLANEYLNSSNSTIKFKEGGSFNIIPNGALHARLHHMENADNLTKKGIPVVSEKEGGELEQQAEIEKEEIILRLSLTKRLEELYKENTDEAAIEAGKLLVDEILNNTIDNTNLLNNIN